MDTTNVYTTGLDLIKAAEKVLEEIDSHHDVEMIVGDGDYRHIEKPWSGAERDMLALEAAIKNMREAIARATERGATITEAFGAFNAFEKGEAPDGRDLRDLDPGDPQDAAILTAHARWMSREPVQWVKGPGVRER